MLQFESSLSIALSTNPPEEGSREEIVVPITSTESLVASRGLATHLHVLYRGVLKNSDHDRAMFAIYDFLSDDMDTFRRRAYKFGDILDPDKAETSDSKAKAAVAISYLQRGQRAHKTGVWLKGKANDEQLVQTYREVLSHDDLTFFEHRDWGYKQSVRNTIYWRQQLEKIRENAYVAELRQTIDESDHNQLEV